MELQDFEQELLPHAHTLLRVARRFSYVDADDLVQETFLRALAARQRYQTGTNGRAWLVRILCNLAVSDQRKRMRDERLRQRIRVREEDAPTAEPAGERRSDAKLLQQALAQLAPAERRMIELADVDELSYREIAQTLDCPIGTVMSRLHRARRRLRHAAEGPARPAQKATRRAAA